MNSKIYDITVIGGGIVGLSTAMAILNVQKCRLALLEAENELAFHQTGRNSGVIHSGLYYKPNSMKAKNCVSGRQLMYKFCLENNVSFDKCGKIVIATSTDELPQLEMLYQRGNQNGIAGIRKLRKEELTEYEPHVTGVAGLFIPETGIVNYKEVSNAFAEIIKKNEGEIFLEARLLKVTKKEHFILETSKGDIQSKFIVNCAGLQSDRIAKLCGIEPEIKIIPFRGEYYKIKDSKKEIVRNLIYPVPDPRFPFLGVHFTRMINGEREAGPNAVLAFKREGYSHSEISIKDSFEMFLYPGFWQMASKYYKMGFSEFYRSLNKAQFVKSMQTLIPSITESDVERGGSGVRAQALDKRGNLLDDFSIIETEKMLHVLNAPSPAATASISIGNSIAKKVVCHFR